MKLNKTLTALAVGASFGLSGQAFAAGTEAGTVITNAVELGYSVGGIDQEDATANVDFKVDNRVDFEVTRQVSITQAVIPNGPSTTAGYAIKFLVKNDGNSSQDYQLVASEAGAITVNIANLDSSSTDVTDNVDTGATLKVFVEEGTDTNNYNFGDDSETYINALAPDASQIVWVVIDDPNTVDETLNDGDIAAVTLTVTTHDDDAAPTLGAATINSATAAFSEDVEQAVFADTNNDGIEFDSAAFEIATAKLVVTKSVRVLSDDLCNNGMVDHLVTNCTPATYIPKALPGALVEFTISVENTGSVASDVYTITDDLSVAAANGIKLDDPTGSPITITDDAGAASTVNNADSTYGKVVLTDIPALAAGATEEVKITAFID